MSEGDAHGIEFEVLDQLMGILSGAWANLESLPAERKKDRAVGSMLGGMVANIMGQIEGHFGARGIVGEFLTGYVEFLTTADDTNLEVLVELVSKLQQAVRQVWEKGVDTIRNPSGP